MTELMEKLSRYWQLRFVVVGLGLGLIVYAVLLPDPGNKSRDTSIQSVAAAPSEAASGTPARPLPPAPDAGSSIATGTLEAWSSKAAWLGENQDAVAQLRLAVDAEDEAELPRDLAESARGLRAAAEKGDAASQFLLGHAYEVGAGVAKDMTATAQWYARAGEAKAGVGDSGVRDFAQAFAVYRGRAEHGEETAELYLGVAYDLGRDVPRSAGQAAAWYRKAAAQGSASAACNLGALYYNGDGMPKDAAEAAVWYRSAANRGSAAAQYSLGRLYYRGDGVNRDAAEAANWLGKAAGQGYASAQVLLSLMSATGDGVTGSTPQAYMWINLASARDERAKTSREQMEKLLSSGEIAEGQKMTHDWLAQHARGSL